MSAATFLGMMAAWSQYIFMAANLVLLVFAIVAIVHRPRLGIILIAIGCVLSLIASGSSFLMFAIAPVANKTGSLPLILIGMQTLRLLDLVLGTAGTILLFLDLNAIPRPPSLPPAQF